MACKPTTAGSGPGIHTETLPSAVAGEVYAVWLLADGSEPLRWSTVSALPDGLSLNPAGAISGTPSVPGTVTVDLLVIDAGGRVDRAVLELIVEQRPTDVFCQAGIEGTFDEGGLRDGEVDWGAAGGLAWIRVALPGPDTTRIDLRVDGPVSRAWIAAPGVDPGSTDPSQYTVVAQGDPIRIDPTTSFSLDTYRAFGAPITVLLVAEEAGSWTARADCTDGPVFTWLNFAPTLLGDLANLDYNVYDGRVAYDVEGDLPDWIEWTPESARLRGMAVETGSWEFLIHATAADGRHREEVSGFGVYDIEAVSCDEWVAWAATEGFYDGDLATYFDPEGYRVFALSLDNPPAAVTAHLDDVVGAEVGFALPGYPAFAISGRSAGGEFALDPSVSLTPRVFPTLRDYAAATDDLYAVAYTWAGTPDIASFFFACDNRPWPDLLALPVLEVGGNEVRSFDVIGGIGPFVWSAAGLPPEVALAADGTLSATSPIAGSWSVDLTVTDAVGDYTTAPFVLSVGDAAACGPIEIVDCGQMVSGTLAALDSVGYCLTSDAANQGVVGLSLTAGAGARVDLALLYPGHDLTEAIGENSVALLSAVDGGDDHALLTVASWPPVDSYVDLPIFVQITAAAPGDYELTLSCL